MMKPTLCLLLFQILYARLVCAESAGPIAEGMAGTGVTSTDFWSVHQNPAGLTGIESSYVALRQLNHFGIGEWNDIAFSAGTPMGKHHFIATGLSQEGFSGLSTTRFCGSAAILLGRKWSSGMSLNLYNQSTKTDLKKNRQSLNAIIGCIYRPNSTLSFGFTLSGLSTSTLTRQAGTIAIQSGINYHPAPQVELLAEAESLQQEFRMHLGFCYHPAKGISCRIGYITRQNQLNAGLGFLLNNWSLDAVCKIHPYLGASTGISICYTIKRHEN